MSNELFSSLIRMLDADSIPPQPKTFQLVPELIEPDGKTVRENNLNIGHKIALGTLVEINCDYQRVHGCRLFVVGHTRDCDGSPLYDLSHIPGFVQEMEELKRDLPNINPSYLIGAKWGGIEGGWSEDALIVIRPPQEQDN